jgi:hypothetical protein
MSSRQTKPQLALRVIAAGCILLWLSANSYCSVEHFFESGEHTHGDGHDAGIAVANAHTAAEPMPQGHGDVAKSQDGNENGQDSDHHDDQDGFCCSTLHATAQTPQQALAAPAFHTIAFLCALLNAPELVSATPEARFDRHARSREWVFTPEVCLGPAFRSHAPPVSSLA